MRPNPNANQTAQRHANPLTVILAGGRGKALKILTGGTAKPALPFGGKYRVIDFILSNIINSNLNRIAILTQFNSESIIEHVKTYENRAPDTHPLPELQIWEPSLERTGREMYTGTADAVYQNREFIEKENCEQVLILSGDQIYHQDYRDLLRYHQEKRADLTISVMDVQPAQSQRFGMLEVDQNQRITGFIEKPAQSDSRLASMGIYVFNTAFLLDCLEKDARDPASGHDFGANIIPPLIEPCKVYAYRFNGYWADVDSVETYWKANLALLGNEPSLNLHDPSWMLSTRARNGAPAEIRPSGTVSDSLITEGCLIEGEVVHSILSPGVHIEKGAGVYDSIVFENAIIHGGAVLKDCLVGVGVEIGANARVGGSLLPIHPHPAQNPNAGLTVIGKLALIPPGMTIERNCLIEDFVNAEDFKTLHVPEGSTVRKSG